MQPHPLRKNASRNQQHSLFLLELRPEPPSSEFKGAALIHRTSPLLCTAASTECPEGPRLACHERNSSHAVVVPFDSTQRPAEPKHGARWIESYIASSESSRWLPCCCVIQFSCHTGQPHRCAESADVYLRSVWVTLSMANIRLVAACGRRYYFHWALFKMERP